MSMSEETKARLRECGRKKREKTVLLKDLTPTVILMFGDKVREEAPDGFDPINPRFKYALAKPVRWPIHLKMALRKALPHVWLLGQMYNRGNHGDIQFQAGRTPVYRGSHLIRLLCTELGIDRGKVRNSYTTWVNPKAVVRSEEELTQPYLLRLPMWSHEERREIPAGCYVPGESLPIV